jgi:hypothetical protein
LGVNAGDVRVFDVGLFIPNDIVEVNAYVSAVTPKPG